MRKLLGTLLGTALALASAASATAADRAPLRVPPAALAGVSRAPAGRIVEAPLGSSATVYLFGLIAGPDGGLWFADLGCNGLGRCGIGRIAPGGAVRLFTRGLRRGSVPFLLTLGPDGNLWFTDEGSRPAIGRITPAGRITEYSRGLQRGSLPFAITTGPDGNLWFTDQGSQHAAIGRITPRGRITEFIRALPGHSNPFGIAPGPGRLVSFTDRGCVSLGRCAIGSITARGRVTESHRGLRPGADPLGIAPGFGGRVWFADGAGAIGQISPSGRISERSTRAGSSPVAVHAGPDGSVWFSDEGTTAALGRLTAAGRVTEYAAGLQDGAQPAQLAVAPDGGVWFTDEGSQPAVGRVTTGASAAVIRPAHVTGTAQRGHTLLCSAPSFARWASVGASPGLFGFDGYRWLRDGVAVPGARSAGYRVRAVDAGHQLACTFAATYPQPFLSTAVAGSAIVRAAASVASGLAL